MNEIINRKSTNIGTRQTIVPAVAWLLAAVVTMMGVLAFAQAPLPVPQAPPQPAATAPAPSYPAAELDRIVSPIALYPDPLLAQVLAAATFATDIPEAARWADEHHYLTGTQLTAAMAADRLPWDPSVQALLPFPSVLDMMASAMPWTQELGDAVLAQRADVMDAVQANAAEGAGIRLSAIQSAGDREPAVHTWRFCRSIPASSSCLTTTRTSSSDRRRQASSSPAPSASALACGSARGSGRGAGARVGFIWADAHVDDQQRAMGTWVGEPRVLHPPVSAPRYLGPVSLIGIR